jgi:hypothetical protein
MGSVAKVIYDYNMRKGFLIYEEMYKFVHIYEDAVSLYCMTLHPIPLNFLVYEEHFIIFFISVPAPSLCP